MAQSAVDRLLKSIPLPKMAPVRQTFIRPQLDDLEAELGAKLRANPGLDRIKKGMAVGISAGSRGITKLPFVTRMIVDEVKRRGGKPFIFPAMGSHGGATADGQADMLRGMGLNEEALGAPIRSSMATIELGRTADGLPVRVDKLAGEADAVILINRIKPHVAFRGDYESGLMKMIAIGLGKQEGADLCHRLGFGRMAHNIEAIGRVVLEKGNLIAGVGLIENAYHDLAAVEVLEAGEIADREPALLVRARELCPKLHFEELEALIIDRIGKDISGTGFDTNFVGRYHTPYASGGPKITRMGVLDLTERSHGNANGVGILDFTTRRLFDKMDFDMTYPNSLTSTVPLTVKTPMVLANDRQVFQACVKTCNIMDWTQARMVRIRDTSHVDLIYASENLLPLVSDHPGLEAIGPAQEIDFDQNGNLDLN